MGTNNFQNPKERKLTRKRVERKAVLIALEDTKSSKYYFQDLLKDKKFSGKVVFAKNIGTNPKKVLESLTKYKKENIKTKFEKEWIVIDRDDWSKDDFNGTLKTAKESGVCVAFSNEAYELWLLLHFQKVTAYTSRQDLIKKLNRYFDYKKSSHDVYKIIIGFQKDAIKNAEKLTAKQIKDNGRLNPYEQNPLTMIHKLVECLNTFKKCDCPPLS